MISSRSSFSASRRPIPRVSSAPRSSVSPGAASSPLPASSPIPPRCDPAPTWPASSPPPPSARRTLPSTAGGWCSTLATAASFSAESNWGVVPVVWDPVTDEWRQLPEVRLHATGWNAAVFCLFAANGSCDHLDCQRGPFAVVLVATVAAESTLSVYSSEACAWSDAWSERSLPSAWSDAWTLPRCYVNVAPTALVGNTLYFLIDLGRRILGCDLPTGETFVSSMPPDSVACDPVLMTMEDGALGVALGQGTRLSLWSMDMETSPNGDIVWTRIRVIELEKLLPVKASSIYPTPVGFFPGVFFFNTDDGLFSISLMSDQVKRELENDEICVIKVVPYMSFYTPAPGLTITDEELAVDGSGA